MMASSSGTTHGGVFVREDNNKVGKILVCCCCSANREEEECGVRHFGGGGDGRGRLHLCDATLPKKCGGVIALTALRGDDNDDDDDDDGIADAVGVGTVRAVIAAKDGTIWVTRGQKQKHNNKRFLMRRGEEEEHEATDELGVDIAGGDDDVVGKKKKKRKMTKTSFAMPAEIDSVDDDHADQVLRVSRLNCSCVPNRVDGDQDPVKKLDLVQVARTNYQWRVQALASSSSSDKKGCVHRVAYAATSQGGVVEVPLDIRHSAENRSLPPVKVLKAPREASWGANVLSSTGAGMCAAANCMTVLDSSNSSSLYEVLAKQFFHKRGIRPKGPIVIVGDDCGGVRAHVPLTWRDASTEVPEEATPRPIQLFWLAQSVVDISPMCLGGRVADGGSSDFKESSNAIIIVGASGRVAVLSVVDGRAVSHDWHTHIPIKSAALVGVGDRAKLVLLSRGELFAAALCVQKKSEAAISDVRAPFLFSSKLVLRRLLVPSQHVMSMCSIGDSSTTACDAGGACSILALRKEGELRIIHVESALAAAYPAKTKAHDNDYNPLLRGSRRREGRDPDEILADIARIERAASELNLEHSKLDSRLASANVALHGAAMIKRARENTRSSSSLGAGYSSSSSSFSGVSVHALLCIMKQSSVPTINAVRIRLTNNLKVPLGAACTLLVQMRQNEKVLAECVPLGVFVAPGEQWEHDVEIRGDASPLMDLTDPWSVDCSLCFRDDFSCNGSNIGDGEQSASALLPLFSGRVDVIDHADALAVSSTGGSSSGALRRRSPSSLDARVRGHIHTLVTSIDEARARALLAANLPCGAWPLALASTPSSNQQGRVSHTLSLAIERRGAATAWSAKSSSTSLAVAAAGHEALMMRLDALSVTSDSANDAVRTNPSSAPSNEIETNEASRLSRLERARSAHLQALALIDQIDDMLYATTTTINENDDGDMSDAHIMHAMNALERLYCSMRTATAVVEV